MTCCLLFQRCCYLSMRAIGYFFLRSFERAHLYSSVVYILFHVVIPPFTDDDISSWFIYNNSWLERWLSIDRARVSMFFCFRYFPCHSNCTHVYIFVNPGIWRNLVFCAASASYDKNEQNVCSLTSKLYSIFCSSICSNRNNMDIWLAYGNNLCPSPSHEAKELYFTEIRSTVVRISSQNVYFHI